MEITIRSDVFGLSSTKHLCRSAVLHPGNHLVMMWWLCHLISNEVLGSTPQTWLNGLAISHVSHLTLSDAPKILMYCTEYNRPTTHLGFTPHLEDPIQSIPRLWNLPFWVGCSMGLSLFTKIRSPSEPLSNKTHTIFCLQCLLLGWRV